MEGIEAKVKAFLEKIPGIVAAYLFGSYAEKRASEQSDVDIALLFEHAFIPAPLQLIEMRESVADELNKSVDLICLNDASPIIGMQVFKNGQLLLETNRRQHQDYLMRLFTDYAELKELRKPIEDNITSRRLYG